jgi:NAD(P)H-hydrate epimerase
MAAVTLAEMLALEADAIASSGSEEALLNAAGENLGWAIHRYFPTPGTLIGYLGKGHNAGDALVAMRVLRDHCGWNVEARLAFPISQCAPLTRKKWLELGLNHALAQAPTPPPSRKNWVLLDGLVGTRGAGPLRAPLDGLAAEMAWLRNSHAARVAAVDLPSGIDPDTGEFFENSVRADVTFMIGSPKLGLLHGCAANAVGALALVEVASLHSQKAGEFELICPQSMDFGKAPRAFDFHKGLAGRVAILAGSECYSGAAVLAASGALRGGAGLVSLFTPASASRQISCKCPPEVMIRSCSSPQELLDFRFDALVVGCGLHPADGFLAPALTELIMECKAPVVIDAGALDLLSQSGKISQLSPRHILTPHPGEFAALAPDLAKLPREAAARLFTERCPASLLLKGSRTLITQKNQAIFCNSTGGPAMASGGQGDLLAGVIGARLAHGDSPMHAAALAAWVCGRSAEIALNQDHISEDSLLPSDVLNFLGAAFLDWRACRR